MTTNSTPYQITPDKTAIANKFKKENSRQLLGEAYQVFLKKQELIKEMEETVKEMETLINEAFQALPEDYDAEDWLLIGDNIIAKWVDPCDCPHIVEFKIIH